jgi:hypothetical protein
MTISLPENPELNQEYTVSGKTWIWNGTYWKKLSVSASAVAALSAKVDIESSFPSSLDSDIADPIQELQAKVGVDGSAVTTSLDYLVARKAPLYLTQDVETASYTLVLGNAGQLVEMNVGSANNLTVPPNSSVAFPVGTQVHVLQVGTGQTTLVAGSGVTINSEGAKLKLKGQWAIATLVKRATDTWVAFGNLAT